MGPSELNHPIHASFNCRVPHFNQEGPLGSAMLDVSLMSLAGTGGKHLAAFLSPVGYSGFLWKLC